ncbi:hypothetical protein LVJ94_33360 [Pendulispora rubella]|uniref:Uncharacterized protein n=1 Tax=Pendulispora rubella TaxID=2741070 RepID=A0ABZ2KT04_9BACT
MIAGRHSTIRFLVSLLFLCSFVFIGSTSQASTIVPKNRLYNADGSFAGFDTNEPGLYFLAPSAWTLQGTGTTPSAWLTDSSPVGQPGTTFDLRMTLQPDYSRNAGLVATIKNSNPNALFFPLPSTIQHVTLWIPTVLGDVEATLTPDDTMATPVAIYYRLRFTREQLDVLRQLTHGGVTLQGSISYAYVSPEGTGLTAAPLTVQLPERVINEVVNPPAPDPTRWLLDILRRTQMRAPGVLDGPYSLGAGIRVNLRESLMTARLLNDTYRLSIENGVATVRPTAPVNCRGSIDVLVVELGYRVVVDYEAALEAKLDFATMQLELPSLVFSKVTVNGTTSPFYRDLFQKLIQREDVKQKIVTALSAELQKRILQETLFGL